MKGGPWRRPHPWGTMIFLLMCLTLASYGLIRFGYGQPANGYVLPSCAGPAPSFSLTRQFSGRSIGVATRFPYQNRVHAFAQVLTRTPAIAEYYQPFPSPGGFPANVACFFARRHILSLIQLDPAPAVSLAAIAAGKYDTYLRQYATAVKRFGARVALSFGHEMNGWWYSWGLRLGSPPSQYRAKPAAFVAAWRHIHDLFAGVGAHNIRWVWTVRQNVTLARHPNWPTIRAWWPGSSYVDWVGMDGYFRRPADTFAGVFGGQVTDIRAITGKPMLICETAVRPGNPDAAQQIAGLFAGARQTRGLFGLVWFDLDATGNGGQWNINHDRAAVTALRTAIGVR